MREGEIVIKLRIMIAEAVFQMFGGCDKYLKNM
jgi:hypothetical protein